jgi:hypothetical protein
MMFLILCLILRNSYQGALFKFLQSDENIEEISSFNDLIDKEYDLYVYEYYKDEFEMFKEPKVAAR